MQFFAFFFAKLYFFIIRRYRIYKKMQKNTLFSRYLKKTPLAKSKRCVLLHDDSCYFFSLIVKSSVPPSMSWRCVSFQSVIFWPLSLTAFT